MIRGTYWYLLKGQCFDAMLNFERGSRGTYLYLLSQIRACRITMGAWYEVPELVTVTAQLRTRHRYIVTKEAFGLWS